jgi:uncharacterized phage protein (TIGR01671 family)
MREIKFRAWDNKKKIMIIQDDMDRLDKCLTYWELNMSVELMQYTGLNDVDGKEIYEGDIVELTLTNPALFEVKFIDGGFCYANSTIKGYPIDIPIDIIFGTDSTKNYQKVVGNKYENPELMEVINTI